MRYRLLQFDLLLGGVRENVDPEESDTMPTTAQEILDYARAKLGRIRLGITTKGSRRIAPRKATPSHS